MTGVGGGGQGKAPLVLARAVSQWAGRGRAASSNLSILGREVGIMLLPPWGCGEAHTGSRTGTPGGAWHGGSVA